MADHALTLRLDKEQWERIRDIATAQETTISAVIREALNEKIERLGIYSGPVFAEADEILSTLDALGIRK